uniref:DDE_Tnp_ISL3 domain-containing protein n=1 Tax=Ascaris lumbricoides TaxID=6252 RepID=A0A0M3HLA1_ASCLU
MYLIRIRPYAYSLNETNEARIAKLLSCDVHQNMITYDIFHVASLTLKVFLDS